LFATFHVYRVFAARFLVKSDESRFTGGILQGERIFYKAYKVPHVVAAVPWNFWATQIGRVDGFGRFALRIAVGIGAHAGGT
jgi:hypothetical protein